MKKTGIAATTASGNVKIGLTHAQRVNLGVVLGNLKVAVGQIRPVWALQDKIQLTKGEEAALGVQRPIVNGIEQTRWNPALSIPVREFDFSEGEMALVGQALASVEVFAAERGWIEPLMDAFLDGGRLGA